MEHKINSILLDLLIKKKQWREVGMAVQQSTQTRMTGITTYKQTSLQSDTNHSVTS